MLALKYIIKRPQPVKDNDTLFIPSARPSDFSPDKDGLIIRRTTRPILLNPDDIASSHMKDQQDRGTEQGCIKSVSQGTGYLRILRPTSKLQLLDRRPWWLPTTGNFWG